MKYGRIPDGAVLYRFTSQVPEEAKLSMNEVNSGRIHFRKRSKIAHIHHEIAAKWLGGKLLKVKKLVKGKLKDRVEYVAGNLRVECPVELWFIWRFKRKNKEGHNRLKPLDSGNCQAMSKGIEDGLVRCGLLGNDTNAFVSWVCNMSLPMTEKQRDALKDDEVEVFILKSSIDDPRKEE